MWYSAIFIMLTSLGCAGSPPKPNFNFEEKSKTIIQETNPNDQKANVAEGADNQVQLLDPCESTVFPLVKTHCGGCHGASQAPLFAVNDYKKACQVLIDQQKVNFHNPEKSVIHIRLKDLNHQCWGDCEANAATLLEQISAWAEQVKDLVDDPDKLRPKSDPLTLISKPKEDATSFLAQLENGTMQGNMQALDAAGALGGKFVTAPTAAGNCSLESAQGVNASVTITINVPRDGNYYICGKVAASVLESNSTYISIDDEPFMAWAARLTGGNDNFQWQRITQNNDPLSELPAKQLTAGPHKIQLRCREPNVRIDALALSLNSNCSNVDENAPEASGDDTAGVEKKLSFDMKKVCGDLDVKLEFQVQEFDEKSYRFRCPRVKSSSKVRIAGIDIFVNGSSHDRYATFRPLDKVVEAGTGDCLSDGDLFVQKEKGPTEDEFAFGLSLCSR